ncbi:MAG: cytosine permease [Clostridiales bacterium]|jgi:cytosine permease|nr:cytosine permease [Clostridiales bacterium]
MSNESSKVLNFDDDYSLEAVPENSSERKSFWAMFVVMLGFTFFSASMSVGATMGNGLNLSGFVWAVIIGGVILGAYTGLLAYVGQATGFSMDLLAQRSFGTKGSYLPSAMISFTQIGWFGVGAAMFAYPVSELTGVNPWIFIILVGICMTSSAYFGMKGLTIVSFVSVPLITILGIISMVSATSESGGWIAMFAKSQGSITLPAAIGMVVGSFVSGGTATPNFVRFAKSKNIAVICTVVAFFIGNTLMFLFGAVGGAYTGRDDIFYVMIAQGFAIPAIIVLGANIWTTNDNALYSAGLGLSNITKIRKKPLTLVSGAIATLAAIWLYNNFISWLSFLNATLPPVGVILILDYFLHKENYSKDSAPTQTVNFWAVAGVVAGALVANFLPWGIASINAMVTATVLYLIGAALQKKAGANVR